MRSGVESVGLVLYAWGRLQYTSLSYMKSLYNVLGDSDAGGDLESRGRDVIFGQDRTGRAKKERRPIDFAIDMFGEGRKVSESTIVPMSWVT